MELREVLRRRRTIRAFEPRPVPAEVLDRVLAAALRAPSAGYTQGTELLVLDRPDTVGRFFELTADPSWERAYASLREAPPPAIVLPLSNKDAYLRRYAEPDKAGTGMEREEAWPVPYWDLDAAMASMLILLAAVDEGLGGWFFGIAHGERELLEAFGVPVDLRPIGAVGLGYPAPGGGPRGSAATRRRRSLDDVVHRNAW